MGKRQIEVYGLGEDTRARAKQSFSTRRVPRSAMRTVIAGAIRPRSGDVVLATVRRLGHHRKLETVEGRRATMHVGDEILVAYGDRYATDQFEAHVPLTLGRTNLVAAGGIASAMQHRTAGMRLPTDITPIGLVGDDAGRPLNLADFALPAPSSDLPRPRTVAVLGTSMNSGKTTTIHYLVHTLARAGARPGATKVTGTGSGGDFWVMLDSGVHRMLDFTDVGMAATYRQPMARLEQALADLTAHLTESGTGVNLVEIADGVYQRETSQLIACEAFRENIDAVIFAAGDAMGAATGVRHLTELGHRVLAVSGKVTASPLAAEEARIATGLPVLGLAELSDPQIATGVLGLDSEGFAPPSALSPAWPEPEDHEPAEVIDVRSRMHHDEVDDLFLPSASVSGVGS